jgi:hypothetical protein
MYAVTIQEGKKLKILTDIDGYINVYATIEAADRQASNIGETAQTISLESIQER